LRTAAALALAQLTPGPRTKLFRIETALRRHPERFAQTIAALTDLLRDGRIRPEVTRVSLEDASAGHRLLEERRARGKVVLIP
jgi:NADPH:quinone reductase-like Zn-dependent oxidoreductase